MTQLEHKQYNLYLDDLRTPCVSFDWVKDIRYLTEDWVVVRSHMDFVAHVEKHGVPKLVSFDHDMGEEHYQYANANAIGQEVYETFELPTGFHTAKWFIEHCIQLDVPVPEVLIHTMNLAGGENIKSLFTTYDKYFRK